MLSTPRLGRHLSAGRLRMVKPSIVSRIISLRRRSKGGDEAAQILAEARRAQASGQWRQAADLYRRHAALRPRRAGSRLQLGNMLKEAGDIDGAMAAYRESLALRRSPEVLLQLGRLALNSGRLDEAAAFFSEILDGDPGRDEAREGLVLSGARDRLPVVHVIPSGRRIARLRSAISGAEVTLARIAGADIAPLSLYGRWRKSYCPPSPPSRQPTAVVNVLIEAEGVAPYRLRGTLQSLLHQRGVEWSAVVQGADAIATHPVASMQAVDSRVDFSTVAPPLVGPWVVLTAGVVLDPFALAWLTFAAERTNADVVYADHDHVSYEGNDGAVHDGPVFFHAPSPVDLSTITSTPAVLFWRQNAGARSRAGLIGAIARGKAAHVPYLLSSEMRLSSVARLGLPEAEHGEGWLEDNAPSIDSIASAEDEAPIRVIIPTRDHPEMLDTCIRSLLSMADKPWRVRILVVDNRSVEPATARLLADGVAAGRFETFEVDEPFNWSRLNNLAAARTSEQLLLFLNNDTKLLTPGWDARLAGYLAQPGVGVVGARLLYPDGSLQHGGLVFGMGDGSPRHEGVGAAPTDGGPVDRWRRGREASAVTGAFLATRRDVFKMVGGFDERGLAIAYNDIDYCLMVRHRGLSVVYGGDIEAIHFESRTRGQDLTRSRIAWDLSERTTLVERWGEMLKTDPSVNPHWRTPSPRPFDGVRTPDLVEALAWLDQMCMSKQQSDADKPATTGIR